MGVGYASAVPLSRFLNAPVRVRETPGFFCLVVPAFDSRTYRIPDKKHDAGGRHPEQKRARSWGHLGRVACPSKARACSRR